MRRILSAELVNGPFGDPGLYVDFRDARRALLFDLGDIGALPPRKILRLSDVFVSHAHMDHFGGLDRLLRVCLGRGPQLRLYGPPGFVERVGHKLAAYTWNLVGRYPGDFAFLVHELAPNGTVRRARFGSRSEFAREPLPDAQAAGGVLLDEPRFRVRAAFLDHGIPCLAFALEEKAHVNVWKNKLVEMGLAVGPWLNELKRAVAEDLPDGTPVRAWWRDRNGEHERTVSLGELKARALAVVPGQKLCYVTDLRYHADNEARVAGLAAGADQLFIESVFLSSEAEHAARKFHLTAAQAGSIARAARAKSVVPFHFSPRYLGREAELVAELERARGEDRAPTSFSRAGAGCVPRP
jgi:ribonuclease Z